MPSERVLPWHRDGDAVVPAWLLEHDEPWLDRLLAVARRSALSGCRQLQRSISEDMPRDAPRHPLRFATHVLLSELAGLDADTSSRGARARLARQARFVAWTERARSTGSRDAVIAEVARRLELDVPAIERLMVADLPGERRVGRLPDDLGPRSFRLRANLRLAQAFVARSQSVTIVMAEHVRRVVQHARWQGLLCTVTGRDGEPCRVELSGPLSVLRTTSLYARALASVVSLLPRCRRFRLDADCRIQGLRLRFRLDERDPIEAGSEPQRHDSRLEAWFERDLRELAPDWDVVREPEALAAAGTLVFPDFAIGPRGDPSSRVLVEIVGYWTAEYVEKKLARLLQAGCRRLVICLREPKDGSALAAGLETIPFRRRVDVAAVLRRARDMLARMPEPAPS